MEDSDETGRRGTLIYEFDSCTLDTSTQQLRRDGEIVHVEPQVLAVIEHLVDNHQRMVPKIELLDEVWGDRFVSESALTSRIKLARRACGDTGREQRIIKTVHSRGYRVVADVTTRRARGGDGAPSATRDALPRAAGASLVGRESELAALDQAMSEVITGDRRSVFITGVTGVGKSALAAQVVERIDDTDAWIVLRGRCIQARGGVEPYFALLDALTEHARQDPDTMREALEHVAPSWLAQLPSLVDDELAVRLERRLLGSSPGRMLREGAEAFQQLAHDRPTVLLLEDLHCADEYTLDVVDLLLQRTAPVPFLLLGTARIDPAPVHELIAEAVGGHRATELRLAGLENTALERLVSAVFDGAAVDHDLITLVSERSDGIPLFATEIATAWARRDLATAEEGVVLATAPLDELAAAVPTTLNPLLERELAAVDPAIRATLEVASVAGITFDAAMLAAGTDGSVRDAEQQLAEAVRHSGALAAQRGVTWPDGTRSTEYIFTHRAYRDVIYETTTPGRRAAIHHDIGLALETGFGPHADDLALTLAEHFEQAGDAARTIEYLRRAGQRAARRDAHPDAIALYRRAEELLDQVPAGTVRDNAELPLRTALASALVATRGWIDDGVAANYERAIELCTGRAPCPDSAAARYGMATVTELRGQFERTEQLLSPLLEAEATGDLAVEAHELIACSLFHQGKFDRSLHNADMVLESWDEDAYSVAMARIAEHPAASCNSWASLAGWCLGHSDASLALAERAVRLGENNRYALSTAAQQRTVLHQLRGEPGATEEWAERTREIGHEQDFPMRIIQADIARGWAIGVTGSPGDGMELIADGLRRFREAGATLNEAYYLGLHADTLIHAGRSEDALTVLDAAFAVVESSTRSYFFDSELHRLRGRALAHLDRLDEARTASDASLDVARRQHSPALELRSATDRLDLERDGDAATWRIVVDDLLQRFADQDPTPDTDRARHLLTL